MKVALVLPARDEEAVIGKMVTMMLAVYDAFITHVIVVDDGSRDQTARIVASLAKKDPRITLLRHHPPYGVGLAIREGLSHVPKGTTHILSMDADFLRNVPDLFDFFALIPRYDGLIGSRYVARYSLIHYPFLKRVFNRIFHAMVRLIYGVTTKDLTNNFKLYKKEVFDALPLSATDFGINAETGLYPVLMGYRIGEIPVAWYARERDMGKSKFRLLGVAPSYIRVLVRAAQFSKRPSARFIRLLCSLKKHL